MTQKTTGERENRGVSVRCDPCIFVSLCVQKNGKKCRVCLGNSCKKEKKRGSKIEKHGKHYHTPWLGYAMDFVHDDVFCLNLLWHYVPFCLLPLQRTQRRWMVYRRHGHRQQKAQTTDVVPRKKNKKPLTHSFTQIQRPRISIQRPLLSLIMSTSDSPSLCYRWQRVCRQKPTPSNTYLFLLFFANFI